MKSNPYNAPRSADDVEQAAARVRSQEARSAITTVLRSLGLTPGTDFTVHQLKQKNKITGVRVYLQRLEAETTVYDASALIESLTSQGDHPFQVTTHTTRSGQHLSDIWWEV